MKHNYSLKTMCLAAFAMTSLCLSAYDGTGNFALINSTDELTEGYYVIASSKHPMAMSSEYNKTYLVNKSITITDGTVTDPTSDLVWKITNEEGKLTIYSESTSKYVSYTGSKNEVQVVDAATSANQQWTATYASDEIKLANSALSTRLLQYNNAAPRFACYTGSQTNLRLFKLQAENTILNPTFTINDTEDGFKATTPLIVELGYTLSISNPNESGKILYGINGEEATTEYSTPIELAGVNSVTAVITDGSKQSETITKTIETLPADRVTRDGLPGLLAGDKSTELYSGVLFADMHLLFQNGAKYYVRYPSDDVNAYTLVYDADFLPKNTPAGAIITANFICKFNLYQNTPQIEKIQHIIDPLIQEDVLPVTPVTVTVAEILNNYESYQHRFVRVADVGFAEDKTFSTENTAGRTGIVTDKAEKSITVYDSFKTLDKTAVKGKTSYAITGFVGRYGDAIQIFPRSNDDIVENTGTGINEATAANLTISTTKGGVIINAAEATAISIYTIAGQLVKTTTVEAGSTLINLPAGVYVIAGSKVVIL